MKIILEHNQQILQTIELTNLQAKALKLMTKHPVAFLTRKIDRLLDFILEQAKQKFAQHIVNKMTDEELEVIVDEMEE